MIDRHERWQRIEALLDDALDLPAGEVGKFLDRSCADDPVLRAEVESLLAADRDAPGFLDGEATDLVAIDGSQWTDTLEGQSLGAWRVVHEIGRGGMSAVYLAERADGQFEQRVAIKVLRRDVASTELARRFQRERQILAALDHSGIVHIRDGGITPDGRPFLVMDYIDGERIDRYCDRHRLNIHDRLRLFDQVLDAVQYAHRNLIVHRDIKPANILITTAGRVRLLDFGIAKLLADEAGDEPSTRTGIRVMTPEYASPEQIRGEHVTTSSDVYALGVLLYELLTGHRPYVLSDSTPYAVERAVCESEPERPSHAVLRAGTGDSSSPSSVTAETISEARSTRPAELRSTLDGDLDAIVMKALRKETAQRFSSVDAFRDDINRYVGGHPVLARQGSRYYTIRKFVSRNRLPVGIAVSVGGMLLASTILISIEQSRTERERVRAEAAVVDAQRESETAAQVTNFLVDLFGGSDPYETLGDTVSAHVLLERGRNRIDRELLDQPAVRASLLIAIGRVYSNLGRHEIADTLFESATKLRIDLFGGMDERVAEVLEQRALNYRLGRNFYDAHGAYSSALVIRRSMNGDQRRAIATDLAGLGYTHRDTGKPDSALALLEQSLGILRSIGDTLGTSFLDLYAGYATTLRAVNRYDEAERIYREIVPRQRELLGDGHPSLAGDLNNLGFLLRRKGEFAEAVDVYREALEILRGTLGDDHPQTLIIMQNLASALILDGRIDDGIEVLELRVDAARSRWPDGDWRLASAESGLGRALLMGRRPSEAAVQLESAESHFTESIGKDHSWTIAVRGWIAACAAALGRTTAAARLFDSNLAQLRAAVIDSDVRASIDLLTQRLEEMGLAERAADYRGIIDAES